MLILENVVKITAVSYHNKLQLITILGKVTVVIFITFNLPKSGSKIFSEVFEP
jgi:hypothetical protein